MKKFVSCLTALALYALPVAAHATAVMPDFSTVPAGWSTDRYAPASFSNVGTYQGRNNVLEIGISRTDALGSRPAPYQSTFYNTQGKQHAITGGAGSTLAADLYIQSAWGNSSNGNVRTDMWGVMTNGASVSDYPIIGFTNYGEAPTLRVWDDDIAGGWVNLGGTINYDAWTSFAIDFTGSSFVYKVNGATVYEDNTTAGSTGFQAVIMQAYNFGDPSIAGAHLADYTVNWSNTQPVPEPGTMILLGAGFLGLAAYGRRRKNA